jgi:hypothetical protein
LAPKITIKQKVGVINGYFYLMVPRLKNAIAASLLVQILAVSWLAGHPQLVETYYSRGIYPYLAGFFHRLYGWIPFSVGDLCYFALSVLGVAYLIRKRHWIVNHPWSFLRDVIFVLSVVHFSFYVLWGMNYFRQPLSKSLGMADSYTTEELIELTGLLAARTNALQESLEGDSLQAVRLPHDRREIRLKTIAGYDVLSRDFPEFQYRTASLKPSLFSTLLSYMGYGGYLNPFTGEAQVNNRLPLFRYPVVCGHEIGHQLGYSAENETNFIGYLVMLRNQDPYFRYAAYAYGLSYCLAEVSRRDKQAFKNLRDNLNPGVLANFRELQDFWKAFENPLEPVFKSIFNSYLQVNRQRDGIRSYNRVVSLMVSYHREHPEF